MMADLTNRVSLLLIGTEGAIAIFSILGLVGVGLLLAGTRLGTGTLLMLVGAVGVAIPVASYPMLLSVLMAPIVNATGSPIDYPGAGYYVISLAPALALLVGTALAFAVRGRPRS